MRKNGISRDEILREIDSYRALDIPWDGVLNSICSKPLDIGVEAFNIGIDTNLGDKRIFNGTAQIEKKVIKKLGNLLSNQECAGNIVAGGTEANLLAIYAAKNLKKDIKEPEILFSKTVHFSILKTIQFMGIKYKIVEVDENYKMSICSLEKLISKNTIAIIATAGSSELGVIDPIEEISEIAFKNNIYLHVDAATGGFIIPFARNLGIDLPQFDFSNRGVCSITLDPHKYGLVPIPAGGIIFRNVQLQKHICLESYFIGTNPHTTFLGTRPGAAVLATYAVIETLGIEGFNNITKNNYENTKLLISGLKKLGYNPVVEPELNIVAFQIKNAEKIMNILEQKGIIVSSSKNINNTLRIVVNNHVSSDMIINFINIIKGEINNE